MNVNVGDCRHEEIEWLVVVSGQGDGSPLFVVGCWLSVLEITEQ